MNLVLKIGNFLFRYRSFTPVPLILIVFLCFKPVSQGKADVLITAAGFLTAVAGEAIRILAVGYSFSGTSGRENFLRADSLNVSGIYSVVRNPLYIGNLLIYSGLLIAYSNLFALLFFDLLLILQYFFIIRSEEDFLDRRYGGEYRKYRSEVRSILPRLHRYQKPVNPFSRMKVILKENDSIFNALVIFGLILMYKGYLAAGRILHGKSFIAYFSVLAVLYILIKLLKKKLPRF